MRRDQLRAGGLGASEVPAIFGESPYSTASDVWLDRMGLAHERSTPAMSAGNALEVPILRLAGQRLDTRFHHNGQTFHHPDPAVPLFATPDGFGPGRTQLAEVKLVGYRFADWREGPAPYAVRQVQAQLACLPRAEAGILIALLGSDLRTYRIARDPDIERAIVERVRAWWQDHIVGERSPDPVDAVDEWNVLKATTSTTGRAERLATPDEQKAGAELLVLAKQAAALEARTDELKRLLARDADESDVLGVGWQARWTSRASVSWKDVALAAGASDDLVAAHSRQSTSFAFRPVKVEEGARWPG